MTPSVCPSKRLTATASSGPDGFAPSARDSAFGSTGGPDASAVTPAASTHVTRASATTPRTFAINMARITPSVRAATLAGITPGAAACPAATRVTALIVFDTTATGAPADATFCASTAAIAPPDSTTPRRASRFASITRARASRLATLPSGMPSCRAASLRVMPSRSHRTITPR